MKSALKKSDTYFKNIDFNRYIFNSIFFVFAFWCLRQIAYLFQVSEQVSVFYPSSGFAMLLIYYLGPKYLPVYFIAIIVSSLPQSNAFVYDLDTLSPVFRQLVIYGTAGLILRKINSNKKNLDNIFVSSFILASITTALLSAAFFAASYIKLDSLLNLQQLDSVSLFFVGDLSGALMSLPIFVFYRYAKVIGWGAVTADITLNIFKLDKTIGLTLILLISSSVIYLGSFAESFTHYYYFILIPIISASVKWGMGIGLMYAFIGNVFTLTIYSVLEFSHLGVLQLQVVCAVSMIAPLLIGPLHKQKDLFYENSMYDELTGLANMRLFKSVSTAMIASARRNKAENAFLFIDIDGFKAINDAFGHKAGDELLKHIGQLLQSCIRDSDAIARFGGDEFIIQLDGNTSKKGAASVALNIIKSISNSFDFDKGTVSISASIGIAIYPQDGKDIASLINKADRAMYIAKDSGKSCYKFYRPELS
jgi:diguanylate cyclase (GGDEF)-like protein